MTDWRTEGHQVLRRDWRSHGPRLMTEQARWTMLHCRSYTRFCVYVCVKCLFNACAKSEREKSRDMCGREGSGVAGSQLTSHSVCVHVCVCVCVCSNQRTELAFTYLLSFAEIWLLLYQARHDSGLATAHQHFCHQVINVDSSSVTKWCNRSGYTKQEMCQSLLKSAMNVVNQPCNLYSATSAIGVAKTP
jgi:hypothetical protein